MPLILFLVAECLVALLAGFAMATFGAGPRFVVLFSLFTLLLSLCFDPFVFSYFRFDQAWLVVSNAAVVAYFVVGWLFCGSSYRRELRPNKKRGDRRW